MNIQIEVSARHVHLTAADWQALFGTQLPTLDHPISQAPQFVARERLKLVGPKGEIDGVALVGPFREYTQVELAASDARRLGVQPPLSDSGLLDQAAIVTFVGPAGTIKRPAVIVQRRHLHASPEDATQLGISDRQEVSVRINGLRGGVLDHVLVRIDPKYSLRLHLDTDEANAIGVTTDSHAVLA